MMNKKLVGVIVVLITIIVIVTGLFFFINKDKGERITDVDTDKMADDIGQYVDKDKNEIKDILEQEITDEQRDTVNIALDSIELPEDTKVNDEGQLYVTDEDGQDQLIDHPHQDIIDMTDEEAEEDYDKMMDELNQIISSGGKQNGSSEDVTDAPDISGKDDTSTNKPSGNVWDQDFYDTLNDHQKELYKNYDDESRENMKDAVEITREWEKDGYEPIGGQDLTGNDVTDSWSHIGKP